MKSYIKKKIPMLKKINVPMSQDLSIMNELPIKKNFPILEEIEEGELPMIEIESPYEKLQRMGQKKTWENSNGK